MKALFILEQLVQRDPIVNRAEILLSLFDSVDVLTFAHAQGQIWGEIERCKISSSPFFKNIKTIEEINRKKLRKYLTAKTISLPTEKYDMVLTFSTGWASLINVKKAPKKFVVTEDWDESVGKLLSFEMKKSLEQYDGVIALKKNLASMLNTKSIVPFGFPSKEYSHEYLITNFRYYVVSGENLTLEQYQLLKKMPIELKVYTKKEISFVDPNELILGDCDAVHISALSQAKVWIDLGAKVNTDLVLGALALRIPTWAPREESFGASEFIFQEEMEPTSVLANFEDWYKDFDREKARRFALSQNERAFKRELWKEICKN